MKSLLKSRTFLMALLFSFALALQACHAHKNGCTGCPGQGKKKVRKSSKGSI